MSITKHNIYDAIRNVIGDGVEGNKPFLVPSARIFEHLRLHEPIGKGEALDLFAKVAKRLDLNEQTTLKYLGEIHPSPSGKTPCTSQDYRIGEIVESFYRTAQEQQTTA